VAASAVVTFVFSARYNLSEALRHLTQPYEYLQLDELPVVFLVAASGLAWFAWRRYREARCELMRRRTVEAHLAEALDEKSRLARRFIDAQEAERRSLARELHDELGQYLNAIKLDAVSIGNHAMQASQRARAQGIVESVDRMHRVVQMMIRRFRPVALDELGLQAALEHSMEHWQRRMPGTTLCLSTKGNLEHCGEPANLAIYRMVQEGLTNISRHARASRVLVHLERRVSACGVNDEVRLAINDDGVGADLRIHGTGLGLIGMRERAELLGGQFHTTSRPGHGFALIATLPVTAGEPL
jgi:glucose-6-phosphate-specific signal transduction histidine kinase